MSSRGFPGGSALKESACNAGDVGLTPACGIFPLQGKIPWRGKLQPIPIFLSKEFHGQRSLAGYSPWGCKSQTQLSN